MTEEEFFIKNYPDFCYGDKPLSPHWDLFQYGVEFGERESEKKIAELTEQNTSLLTSVENLNKSVQELEQKLTEKVTLESFDVVSGKIKKLEQENAELKKQLEMSNKVYNDNLDYSHHIEGQLTKAKKIIEKVAKMYRYSPRVEEIIAEAEQFLKYSEVEK